MKSTGLLLITGGFILGAFAAVEAADTVRWMVFGPAAAVVPPVTVAVIVGVTIGSGPSGPGCGSRTTSKTTITATATTAAAHSTRHPVKPSILIADTSP